ncbi:antibiotic biosynthesis monooxygenase [Alteromonas aestuariivivens]|uniref:Antibiotic biosynthesis monooxygenase n=1 Tax=Alteromonas aestuariivivens TaxID=1938339 RepID=A0A3D8ME78_9ALTE|nr:putative quinol monooxygenase [Alteromonas aestuariivivens]RDV29137.1 antibiotic biosynthesis monooxygenase [Alteromonas aestuariivivens]
MYIVTVKFLINEGQMQAFMPAMLKQAEDSLSNEEACTVFDVAVSENNPNLVFLYEIYNSKADFEYHLETEHFKTFSDRVGPLVADKQVECFHLQK